MKSDFGESWWALRWRKVLESFGWADRLTRGRSYARSGAVQKVEITPGEVQARVQGSRPTPYRVRMAVRPLNDAQWDAVIAAMGAEAIYAAQLLAGEMPQEIERVFTAAQAPLFPTADELDTDCDCPDWGNPCKHVAAVYYVLGAEFDRDPFLLFRLRGRDRAAVLAALRQVWAAAAEAAPEPAAAEEPPPAAAQPAPPSLMLPASDDFWHPAVPLDGFRALPMRPPQPAALPQRLGPPAFWHPPGQFLALLGTVYTAVTDAALAAGSLSTD